MSIPREIIWGPQNQGQLIEDSLEFTDGELGELDEASFEWYIPYVIEPTDGSSLETGLTAGIRKNELCDFLLFKGQFFVRSMRFKQLGSQIGIATISCVGQSRILSGQWQERRLREISAYGQMVSVGPIEKVIIVEEETEGIDPETGNPAVVKRRVPKVDALGEVEYQDIVVTGSGTSKRWNINDPTVSVTDTYFVITQPLTNVIGTALTPPTPPLPPPYKWTGYNEPLRGNAPSGWVLDDRRISVIIPNQIWRVVDTFNFYQAAVPD